MVLLDSKLNSSRVKRDRRLDFPTPESPIRTTTARMVIHGTRQAVWKLLHDGIGVLLKRKSYSSSPDIAMEERSTDHEIKAQEVQWQEG
jgi:hypothetical protein